MPVYEYRCPHCGEEVEKIQQMGAEAPECCGEGMCLKPSLLASYPKGDARRKWAENWTPDSPKFSTGSLHGEHY